MMVPAVLPWNKFAQIVVRPKLAAPLISTRVLGDLATLGESAYRDTFFLDHHQNGSGGFASRNVLYANR